MRWVGGVLLLLATCGGLGLGVTLARLPPGSMVRLFMIIGLLLYLIPGIAFIVFSIYLKRRQFWAVIASLVLASGACLFSVIGLAGMLVAMSQEDGSPYMLIPIGVLALAVLAFGQLIYHLSKSFEAIKHMPPDEHGFEPIMAYPVATIPPTTGGSHVPPSDSQH